jgi:hypothetical protein
MTYENDACGRLNPAQTLIGIFPWRDAKPFLGAPGSPTNSFRAYEFACRNNLLGERFEAWIAVQWSEQWIDTDCSDVKSMALPIAFFEAS